MIRTKVLQCSGREEEAGSRVEFRQSFCAKGKAGNRSCITFDRRGDEAPGRSPFSYDCTLKGCADLGARNENEETIRRVPVEE